MSIVSTAKVYELLRAPLDQIKVDYDRRVGMYNDVYTTYNSFLHQETDMDMKNTGLAVEKMEGGQIQIDSIEQSHLYSFTHKNFGIGLELTEEVIQDSLYMNQFNNGTRSLINSYEQTKELMAMVPFNNAFNENVLIGDGEPLVSPNHPYVGGVFSNQIGATAGSDGSNIYMDISETGIEQAVITAQKLTDQAGLPIAAGLEALLVPADTSQFTGFRLTESIGQMGSANNDPNIVRGMNLLPKGIIVNTYLASGRWFALTTVRDTRRHYLRTKFNITMTMKPDTRGISILGNGRYSFGMFTPLGVIGAQTPLVAA